MSKFLVLLIAAISLCGCTSLVYSPSVNLTNTPIRSGEVDLQGGAELLPETRPDSLGGSPFTLGVGGQLSYGFTDNFNLTLKGWADVEGRGFDFRSGYSINAQFIEPLSPDDRLIILPRIGMALDGNDIEGYGVGASLLYQREFGDAFSWYSGPGVVWGFRYLETSVNAHNEEKLPMGFALIANLGLGWEIYDNLRLNAEVNPVYQINTFESNSQIILSPSIGFGYTFR